MFNFKYCSLKFKDNLSKVHFHVI